MQALEKHRLRKGLDVFVVPEFAQKYLGFDPAQLQQAMEANYPVRGAGDKIEWARPQWVEGDNATLHYRGRELKRGKSTSRAAAASALCVPRRPARPLPKLTSLASGRGSVVPNGRAGTR